MEVQEIRRDVPVCAEELLQENSRLRSEITWRKEEVKLLRRTIGRGRIYHKLRECLRDTEKENTALRERLAKLEAEKKSRKHFHVFKVSFFHKVLQRLVKSGDSLQHSSWNECRCGMCRAWREAKEELGYHFGVMSGNLECVDSEPKLDKVASL